MREYVLVLLVAAATTFLASGLARKLAIRFGAVAQVRDRDVHTIPIPYFGGVAMLLGLAAAFVVALQLPWLSRHDTVAHDASAVLLAGAVICAVGILDDLFELHALTKVAGQILAAGIVVLNGVKIYWIPLPESIISLDDAASIGLTVAVVFLCVNAINFVDGLDGLAAGVVAIGASAFFSYSYLLSYDQNLVRATTASLITVTTAGICLGFLPHNVHRARMFMGDSGAMLLGLLLATSTISLTGQIDPSRLSAEKGGLIPAYLPLFLPFAIMALPFLDLVLAYFRRTLAGKLWYVADKQHLHHRVLELGHSHRRAVILMWLWSAIISFGAIAIGLTASWLTVAAVAAALVGVALFTFVPARRVGPRSQPTPPDPEIDKAVEQQLRNR